MCLGGEISFEFIGDDETLARIIFSPSMLDGDSVAPSAFNMVRLPRGDEKYVSVHRIDYCCITYESIKATIKPRVEGDSISGYATLKASQIRSACTDTISVDVKPKPSKSNQYHAGIFYYESDKLIKGACLSPDFLLVTTVLAKSCKYIFF